MGKKNVEKAVDASIKKLLDGELDIPLTYGLKVKSARLDELETLRKKMLAEKIEKDNAETETDEKIASVAHDLKTPIATISGYAECIQDGIDDKDYPSLIIEKAKSMNEQVLSIVDGVRSKESSGKKKCVNTDALFERIFEEVSGLAKSKNIKVVVKKVPKTYVYVDIPKIFRVVENIFSNAVKYTPENGKIVVKCKVWADKFVVKIKDDGQGIKKADRERIFEKFYMSDKSRGGKGSGLGLYICKEFLADHGGDIYAKSDGKKGAEIIFTLPIVRQEEKLPATERFEKHNVITKLILLFFFGWIYCAIYRFERYSERRSASTLIGAFLCLIPFSVLWAVDFISEIFYGRITFLAD